jgi:hypothetical protein
MICLLEAELRKTTKRWLRHSRLSDRPLRLVSAVGLSKDETLVPKTAEATTGATLIGTRASQTVPWTLSLTEERGVNEPLLRQCYQRLMYTYLKDLVLCQTIWSATSFKIRLNAG